MNKLYRRFLVDPTGTHGRTARGRHSSTLIIFSLLLLVFQISTTISNAQTTTSTIEGTVTDANGALVAGATVRASGTTVATERTAMTNADGFYRLSALPAGTYAITISQSGFTPTTRTSN